MDFPQPIKFESHRRNSTILTTTATECSIQCLIALILLIAIAYSCAILAGRNSQRRRLQKYVGRLQELKRIQRRHITFWFGLYGCLWVGAMKFWKDLVIAQGALRCAQSHSWVSSLINSPIFREVYELCSLSSLLYSLIVTPSVVILLEVCN